MSIPTFAGQCKKRWASASNSRKPKTSAFSKIKQFAKVGIDPRQRRRSESPFMFHHSEVIWAGRRKIPENLPAEHDTSPTAHSSARSHCRLFAYKGIEPRQSKGITKREAEGGPLGETRSHQGGESWGKPIGHGRVS